MLLAAALDSDVERDGSAVDVAAEVDDEGAEAVEAAASVADDSADACPLEPVLVWAETVVFSSVASLLVVDDDEEDDGEDDGALADVVELVDDETGAVSLAASLLAVGGDDDAAADDSPEAGLVEPAEPAADEPESSARAMPTSGAASDAPNSAALIPAEAAPSCNHRRTPKSSERRARCTPRPAALPLAMSDPFVNCCELSYTAHVRRPQRFLRAESAGAAMTASCQPRKGQERSGRAGCRVERRACRRSETRVRPKGFEPLTF
jgi:hypothetical protein